MNASGKSRYTVIKGRYWINYPDQPRRGPEPDGDTIRFEPENIDLVRKLPWFSGRGPEFNARGNIAVRYEGIDALETHFRGAHQQLHYALAARDENLRLLGFRNISYFPNLPNIVSSVDTNPLEGFVIANGIESNGRLLGLVFPGTTDRSDGSKPFVDSALLDQSINAQLVMSGLAYVEPYDTMPLSLVQLLRQLIRVSRHNRAGLFAAEDVTTNAMTEVADRTALQRLVMWPKLFRRLLAYFAEGHAGLTRFDEWVRADPIGRDDTLRLPDGEKGNIHDTYVVNANALQLRFNPEDVLIAPDPGPMSAQ